ncbi:hypothetical protein MGYG_02755 [Nannizzia gypsea CBS 118893]|uniref:Uncharacterized protein n=1 Tax=Arthroderma gypseum (strain ATCC MYA-4604 / CBS 118893) TaxID=535722 RepID=E4UNY9_ARTGP|nr:hypothetical protein MGYG_02755 [Nannizzia gypsea CBS 118893]EFQ99742.1 hypothetical protein MGYG_02755 [Nannizzia gypsea CBS 118893]
MDCVASIYLGELEKIYATSVGVSIAGKLVCDLIVAGITLWPILLGMYKYGFQEAVSLTPKIPLGLWDHLPTDYKYWAMDSLGNYHDQYTDQSHGSLSDDHPSPSSHSRDYTLRNRNGGRSSSTAPQVQHAIPSPRISIPQPTRVIRPSSALPGQVAKPRTGL